jgi:hypothetical protein
MVGGLGSQTHGCVDTTWYHCISDLRKGKDSTSVTFDDSFSVRYRLQHMLDLETGAADDGGGSRRTDIGRPTGVSRLL